jgi:dipeptidyl-peptidase-4
VLCRFRAMNISLRAVGGTALLLAALCISASAQQKMLTIDTIFDPQTAVKFGGSPTTGLHWLADGPHYLQFKPAESGHAGELVKVDAVTGQSQPFYDAGKMQAALAKVPGFTEDDAKRLSHRDSYTLNPAETAVLLNYANDLFYYEFGSDRVMRLTNDPQTEVGEEFSPDGKLVSFVRGNNVYVVDLYTLHERPLTSDGNAKVLNGRLDWIYQEELYGRGKFQGYWWSPDSSKIAFLKLDDTEVPTFTVSNDIPYQQDLEATPYPKAGDPNPKVQLGVADVAGGRVHWVDTYKYGPAELLISRVAWTPDSKYVSYQAQDREQTWLDLNFADPLDGKSRPVIHETSKAWVEVIDDPHWLGDGSFLWLSERTGYRHIYHYSADGNLIKQVTDGEWEARTIDSVDPAKGIIYFSGTEHSPIGADVYRVNMDGTGLARLSKTDGTHRGDFSPNSAMYFDSWSDASTPAQVSLCSQDGSIVRMIAENPVPALNEYKLGKVEFLKVKTRDGFTMDAEMIKPPDFDPTKKYPVWCYTYSGPHSQTVRNAWGGTTFMWHQMLAERGYIIWMCDNRTASGKGVQSTWPVYHNFGELELRDLEDGLSWLKGQPYVDGSRIGMWGWSFGGFMTSYALTHSKSFKIGIAGGTVSDWRDYDSIYTERYMGMPQKNLAAYEKDSVRLAAPNLSGNLLLIHGTMDDNVHMANTIQLVYALQNAGKPFHLMVYPMSRHGVTDPLLVKHLRQTMTDFILQNL